MHINDHKHRYPEDIIVTIEEFDKANNKVVFDVFDEEDLVKLRELMGNQYGRMASMIQVNNYRGKKIQENTIYAIKPETVRNWLGPGVAISFPDSFILSSILEFNTENPIEMFGPPVSLGIESLFKFPGVGNTTSTDLNHVIPKLNGKITVIVKNVGQGNWNEIQSRDQTKIVYDMGAATNLSKVELRSLIANRINSYTEERPGIIISHWDKDHYHGLVGLTDEELRCFSFCICRDQVPNNTCEVLYDRIRRAIGRENMHAIPTEFKSQRGGPTLLIPVTDTKRQLVVYNAQYHKNRNISGIVISLKTAGSSAILPADHNYDQLSRDLLPHLNYRHQHNLVVPHHGGNAGPLLYKRPGKMVFNHALISCGMRYGGTRREALDFLLERKFKISSTLKAGEDLVIHL